MRTLLAIIGVTLAACSPTPERQLSERLVGAWQQEISVLGRNKSSVLSFSQDGSFVEQTYEQAMQGWVPEATLPGRWEIHGDEIRLEYLTGFTGHGTPEIEIRKVTRLTDDEFISMDSRFGLRVERKRLKAQ